MIGTILQLSAAFLFGYQIALRNKLSTKNSISSNVFINGKPTSIKEKWEPFYETYMYRIGFIYLILGYLIPLTKISIGDDLNSAPKIFLVIFIAIILVIIGDNISKIIAKRHEEN